MSRFDAVKARLDAGGQVCDYDETMGFRFQRDEVDVGRTVLEATVTQAHRNPNGVLHGGFLAGLADSCLGSCMFTLLADDESCTNVDLDLRFLRPALVGDRLRAESETVKVGRTTTVLDCRITDEHGRLVATARSTFLRLKP